MKRTKIISLKVIVVAALFSLLFLGLQAEAKSVVPIEGRQFGVSVSMRDNLKGFIGKDVSVHLRSGKTLQGYVMALEMILSIWKNCPGEIFYETFIRIEDISAMDAKFRDLK